MVSAHPPVAPKKAMVGLVAFDDIAMKVQGLVEYANYFESFGNVLVSYYSRNQTCMFNELMGFHPDGNSNAFIYTL